MLPHLDPDVPVVGICNISEAFVDFLNLAQDPAQRAKLIRGEQYRGDRALVWMGDPKLVFMSLPVPHADYLCRSLGYDRTAYRVPSEPSPWLCLDILREKPLIEAIVAYAGKHRVVQIVPYATTPQFLQLVTALREEYGLTVLLPETPPPYALWVRDYIDTKAGFRVLASRWLSNAHELIPDGIVCETFEMAAEVVHWYHTAGRSCLVKCDIGENGIGNIVMHPSPEMASSETIVRHLREQTFLGERWLTVEEFIHAASLSPSLEVFVPHAEHGEPYITYLSDQVFQDFGDFCGVLVSRELTETPWYRALAESGLGIARQLQAMGYVGHFDMDCVVDDHDRVYLLEINARRTGGTHVHDFAYTFWGADYLDRVALLSHDTMHSGAITRCEDLLAAIGDLQYPISGAERGVIVIVTSALEAHEFGCIFVGVDKADTLALQQQVDERVWGYRTEN